MIISISFNSVFEWCVQVLTRLAEMLGMTYEEVNIWIFVIIQPIAFLLMCWWIVHLYREIYRLRKI